MLHSILAAALWGSLWGDSTPNTHPNVPDGVIGRWIAIARSSHPEATSASEAVGALRAEEAGARSWMPPTTQLQYQSDGRVDLSLVQMVPGFGKLDAESSVRARRTDMARADSSSRLLRLSLSVREAAWMEWMARRKAAIQAEQVDRWTLLGEALGRTQAQGMTTPSETWLVTARIHQAKVDLGKARAEVASSRAMRESFTGPTDDTLDAGQTPPPDWDSAALLESSHRRPDIAGMRQESAMQTSMSQAMERSLRPDIMVGAMAMRMNTGMPGWGVMAGMTLPFVPWASSMAGSGAAGSRARSRETENKAQAMERMAVSEVADHLARARAAWSGLRELDSLVLPGQERAVADARSRYAQGREMLPMVFAMEDMVRMTRMEAVMLRGEYEIERARLNASAGIEPGTKDGVR